MEKIDKPRKKGKISGTMIEINETADYLVFLYQRS